MNNLPKVVAQQRRGRASNPRLLDRKSDALPLSHRATPSEPRIVGRIGLEVQVRASFRSKKFSASWVGYGSRPRLVGRWLAVCLCDIFEVRMNLCGFSAVMSRSRCSVQIRCSPMWSAAIRCSNSSPSSRMRVINHNSSATKQRLHPQSVAEISRHSVLSRDMIRQCGTSSGSRHKDTYPHTYSTLSLHPVAHNRWLLLISRPAEGKSLSWPEHTVG